MTIKPGLSYHLHHIVWSGLDLLFPPTCAGCGKPGMRWCADCQRSLEPVPLPLCEVCGSPQSEPGLCSECVKTRPAFRALRSCFVYKDPARQAVIGLKYRNERGLGEIMAWNLALFLDGLGWQVDVLIPIPLSAQRLSERGYNQVDMIGKPLAGLTGREYLPKALNRVRHTPTQVGLAGWERRKNVLGAFQSIPKLVKAKSVLVLDDVSTTGATLNSASESLLDAGARTVYALTFAKAIAKYNFDSEKPLSEFPSV